MSEELEYFPIGLDFPLHLIQDLFSHDDEVTLDFERVQTAVYLRVLNARLIDASTPNQLTRRVGHERSQSGEKNYTPWYLDTKR